MNRGWRLGLVLLLLVPLLSACGEEVDLACGSTPLGLDGTWFGAMEDDQGTLFTLEWRICGDRISGQSLSGIDYGIGGHLVRDAPGVYVAYLDDGSEARLLTAPGRDHGLMVNEFFDFSVLERGARFLPRQRYSDLDGSWNGRHARLLPSVTLVQSAWAWCGSGLCSQTRADGVSVLMDFDEFVPDYGLYRGDYEYGIAGALLSPDREVMATYTCPVGYRSPADCGFALHWRP